MSNEEKSLLAYIKEDVNEMKADIKSLLVVIPTLQTKEKCQTIHSDEKNKNKLSWQWRIGIGASIIIGVAGIIVKFIQ